MINNISDVQYFNTVTFEYYFSFSCSRWFLVRSPKYFLNSLNIEWKKIWFVNEEDSCTTFFSGSIPGRNIFWKVKHCSMSVQKLHIAKFSTWLSEFWSWRLTEVLMIQCLLSERSGVCRLGGDFCWTKTWHEMNVILNRVTTEQGILHTHWAWWFSSLKKNNPSNSTYIEDNRAKVEKK